MVTVRVLKAFHGYDEGRDFVPGDEFEATDERGTQIAERIPGFVELEPMAEEKPEAEEKPKPARRRTTRKAPAGSKE